jgi:hypothetical protein
MNLRWLSITAILLMVSVDAGAKATVVPPRPGQVGLSLQGQYGTFMNQGTLGEDFGSGPGLAVRVRYRMRYERAIGLSFESQGLDARPDAAFTDVLSGLPIASNDPVAPAKATVELYGADFYKLFGTRTATTRMLSVSAGLARISFTLNDKETGYAPDGVYLGAGAGVERFFFGSWAWDLSGRYVAVFDDGSVNHLFQASAGVIIYASY